MKLKVNNLGDITMDTRRKLPFVCNNSREFKEKLPEWVGDVLYDILPEKGYEERDEQIYTAFQIADAFCTQQVHLAEAGLGTGKTFAYLLSAIPYARFTGKPVVIACATSTLQEQLASEAGDIATLSKLLGLEIDARMAKDSSQYVCDIRAMENMGDIGETADQINQWLLQTTLGQRSEIPHISDRMWKKISWNEFVNCDICDNRGYCKLVKARKHYREAVDLIIVDHETFFQDLWTRDEKIADGKLPILPNYSAVIFDEGHKVLLPAAMKAGHRILKEEMDELIHTLFEIQDARPSLVKSTLQVEKASYLFFRQLRASIVASESSARFSIRTTKELLTIAQAFGKSLDQLLMEMQIEQELYMESLTPTQIQAFEGQIERATIALHRFTRNQEALMIPWVDRKDASFWVVPRNMGELLEKYLYSKKIPIIFVSATLSNHGDFSYFSRTIGLKKPSSSSIGSSFDLENQVKVRLVTGKEEFADKVDTLVSLMKENGGRTLVLTNSMKEVKRIRKQMREYELPFQVLWEDQGDRGYLVKQFREDENSVLVGADLWEGIDVPGDALTMVVIWQLPFPEIDPLIEVQRKEVKAQGLDPVTNVDYPEMGLKLKQGCGRLVRTSSDKGTIVILAPVKDTGWEKIVMDALPEGAPVSIE